MAEFGLIADVGGTNIRLGLVDLDCGTITNIKKYLCADYPAITDVINLYLEQVDVKVDEACIAIACPVEQDLIQMTNHGWCFSKQETKQALGLKQFNVINDYTAISMSIPALTDEQKVQIGGQPPEAGKPIAVYGPGTGLGVAHLINHADEWISLPGEGGHVDFAPQTDLEIHILKALQKKYSRVSAERLLSGPGIVDLYEAVASYMNVDAEPLNAADITSRALDKACPVCQETFAEFCRLLGSFGGNLAVTMATFGGVYIAGGIVPRFLEAFIQSEFRAKFEDKGRFCAYNKRIPVFVITEEQPGLIGASVYLRQATGHKV